MQPRFYMQIFLSLNATGSVEAASSLTQSMHIFDRATTIMSPWSMKSFSQLPFFPPISEVNMGWHPQKLLPFSCWQKKSHTFLCIYNLIMGARLFNGCWEVTRVIQVWVPFVWDATMQQTVTIKMSDSHPLLIPHQHVFQNFEVFTLTLKMGKSSGSPESGSNLLCNINYFWKVLKKLYRAC